MSFTLGSSKLWLIHFYKEQLSKFKRLGLGRETQFGVIITEKLIKVTEKRLADLTLIWDSDASHQALYQRRLRHKKKGQTNGISNTNGATVKPGE